MTTLPIITIAACVGAAYGLGYLLGYLRCCQDREEN